MGACTRYVSKENIHCDVCTICPSKDGRTYVHCNTCKKCVKPGRVHCSVCKSCELDKHNCNRLTQPIGCHICGDLRHKRKDCPKKEIQSSGVVSTNETTSNDHPSRKRRPNNKEKNHKQSTSAPVHKKKRK